MASIDPTGEQLSAFVAADIQGPHTSQVNALADVAHSERIDVVQRFEFTGFIPPLSSQFLKLVDFPGINVSF